MTRASGGRVFRRKVRQGILNEVQRRTGRDGRSDAAVRELIKTKIQERSREDATHEVVVPNPE